MFQHVFGGQCSGLRFQTVVASLSEIQLTTWACNWCLFVPRCQLSGGICPKSNKGPCLSNLSCLISAGRVKQHLPAATDQWVCDWRCLIFLWEIRDTICAAPFLVQVTTDLCFLRLILGVNFLDLLQAASFALLYGMPLVSLFKL